MYSYGLLYKLKIWETFATSLHQLTLYKKGLDTLDHYLDDFIFAGKEGSRDCAILMSHFYSKEIGVQLAEGRTAGPTTQLTFLGFEIDSADMTENP